MKDDKPKRFIDTCAALSLGDRILDEPFVISYAVISELEHIKTSASKDESVKYRARQLTRLLTDNIGKYEVFMSGKDKAIELGFDDSHDSIILAGAIEYRDMQPITFVTDDLLLRLRAGEYGLDVIGSADILGNDTCYTGYKMISGNTDYLNDYMNSIDYSKWYVNEYLIAHNTDDDKTTEMRFNGDSFTILKYPKSNFIKAKNPLQRCALDLLTNKDITIAAVLGGYGSGKSFLTTKMAIYNVIEKGQQSKILCVREPKGEGSSIGFLPGDLHSKTESFFKPIEQQLGGGEFEMNNLLGSGIIETNIPYYLKGTTYNDTIILVEEAEDLTESQIRLIGSRVGTNGKIYFSGDYEQSIINKTRDNALVKMCNEFKGNPMFGCIYLGEDVRSETSKLFTTLYRK